jgi:hypothetical protein
MSEIQTREASRLRDRELTSTGNNANPGGFRVPGDKDDDKLKPN